MRLTSNEEVGRSNRPVGIPFCSPLRFWHVSLSDSVPLDNPSKHIMLLIFSSCVVQMLVLLKWCDKPVVDVLVNSTYARRTHASIYCAKVYPFPAITMSSLYTNLITRLSATPEWTQEKEMVGTFFITCRDVFAKAATPGIAGTFHVHHFESWQGNPR